MQYIEKKSVPLSHIKDTTFATLRDNEVKGFFSSLERQSVIKKLDTIFELCHPPRDFVGMPDYLYDKERVKSLDQLRHDCVHRAMIEHFHVESPYPAAWR
jgi:hypothetical protein